MFTNTDIAAIKLAVGRAESQTSAEFRVAVVGTCEHLRYEIALLRPSETVTLDMAVYERARQLFKELGIGHTKGGTGVIICLSPKDRMVAIAADDPIYDKLPSDIWTRSNNIIIYHLRRNNPVKGIKRALVNLGKEAAKHFPRTADDVNELDDGVVFVD
jgi:uncharacterized membrane protein